MNYEKEKTRTGKRKHKIRTMEKAKKHVPCFKQKIFDSIAIKTFLRPILFTNWYAQIVMEMVFSADIC